MKTIKLFPWGILVCLVALCYACSSSNEGSKRSVLVFHSYAAQGEEGKPFQEAMENAFLAQGINADIHHVYLNCTHRDNMLIDLMDWPALKDSITKLWNPELILVNDDPALEWVLTHKKETPFSNLPVVFSGINALPSDSLAGLSNFTGFEDQIDFSKNCNLFHYLTKDNVLNVELDKDVYLDDHLRRNFLMLLTDAGNYIDNSDFHVNPDLQNATNAKKKAQLCVTFFSMKDPTVNRPDTASAEQGIFLTNKILKYAKNQYFLNLKEDIYSNTLIDLSTHPQFTAVREGFNNPERVRFLCGYFTSLSTQINDQVRYAAEILKGTPVSGLSITVHDKGYYLDYNALKKIKESKLNGNLIPLKELSYEKLKDEFTILNAPFAVRNPFWFYTMVTFGIVLLILLLAIGIGALYYWNNKESKKLQRELDSVAQQRRQILADKNSAMWRSIRAEIELPIDFATYFKIPKRIPVKDFLKYVHPDSMKEFSILGNYRTSGIMGQQKIRVKLSFDQGKSWHWYDLIFNVTLQAIQKWDLSGLFLNVDEDVKQAQIMKTALAQAQEARLKEHFLENISLTLESPLKQIQDNTKILSNPDNRLTAEERTEVNKQITEGGQELLKQVDSLVNSTSKFICWILFIAFTSLLSGCTNHRKPLNVLLIHQYSEELKGYDEFHQSLTQTFRKQGFEPQYKNVYLNLEDQIQGPTEGHDAYEKAVTTGDWQADVILGEGDRTVWFTHRTDNNPYPAYRDKVPVVYGGLNYPDWNTLSQYKNVSVITDPLDFTKNIDLAYEFTEKNCIEIELDNDPEDIQIRQQLIQDLKPNPYIYDGDYHLTNLAQDYLNKHYKDSLIILPLSVCHPETNAPDSVGPETARSWMNSYFKNAWMYPQVVVKRDGWGEALCDKTNTPQFTLRRELFGEEPGHYLAGYFADYTIVGKDMAETAIEQLTGAKLGAPRTHEKDYFMDYKAAEYLGLDISLYTNQFTFKNAPMRITHPTQYWAEVIFIISVGLIFIIGLISYVIWAHRRKVKRLQTMLHDERELSRLALQGAHNHYIADTADMIQLLDCMDPAQKELREEIRHTLHTPGSYVHRIHAAAEGNNRMEWWQLRYAVAENELGEKHLEGLIININDTVKQEEKLKHAEMLEKEAQEKENFLWKITHEIRTPLNAVLGFSDLLAQQGDELSYEEKKEMGDAVQESTNVLKKIITDIIQYAHIVNNKVTYQQQEIDVSALVKNCYEKNLQWVRKKGLEFTIVPGRDKVKIQGDEEKVKECLQQLLDNARKFTDAGGIVVGWQYLLDEHKVEIFVEDIGKGIPAQKMPALFNMFWKNDGFIPGIGIGLNIAQSYTEAMGGEIQVETEEGHGSRFMLTFPTIKP